MIDNKKHIRDKMNEYGWCIDEMREVEMIKI